MALGSRRFGGRRRIHVIDGPDGGCLLAGDAPVSELVGDKHVGREDIAIFVRHTEGVPFAEDFQGGAAPSALQRPPHPPGGSPAPNSTRPSNTSAPSPTSCTSGAGNVLDRIEQVRDSDLPSLQQFTRCLFHDQDAVVAGLSSSWSSGQVEGQVTRVKLIKRAGYGRVKLDLLRTRILLRT
ncbi:transposase [Streptomyces sp. NPDC096339]|uniref:transposase n=1 Tax=Streptomyces sp. NPDC096339 TaxID=3366086 RepID=UPI0038100394